MENTELSVKNDEKLVTVQQLADYYGISVRWMRQRLLDLDLEPDMADSSAPGKPKLFYSLDKCELVSSHLKDLKHLNALSDGSQQVFKTGLVVQELRKTPEGRAKLELMTATLRFQCGDIDAELLQEKIEADDGLAKAFTALTGRIAQLHQDVKALKDIVQSTEDSADNDIEVREELLAEQEVTVDTAILISENMWQLVADMVTEFKLKPNKVGDWIEKYCAEHDDEMYRCSETDIKIAKANIQRRKIHA